MSEKSTMCIYHGNCTDGFGSAWVVKEALGKDIEFYPGVYQDAPPDVSGKTVYMVDFSYKRPVLEEMARKAHKIIVIDHHKSAVEDLQQGAAIDNVLYVFDLERSGAMLTWDYFFPDKEPPQLIRHIEDRDLWRFQLRRTREIQACVFSYPYDFDVWDMLMHEDLDKLADEGAAIERKHLKDIDELTKVVTRPMNIGGHVVPVANLPYTLTSDAGHKLADGFPFAGCYWDTPEGRVFSLRSHDDGADVSAIAKQYGGGGHKHASGFRVGYNDLQQFEVTE